MTHPSIVRTGLLALLLWCALALATLAQEAAQATSPEWERLASRAEATLEDGDVTDLALGQLRSELARYREQFLQTQSAGQARIDTLLAQIDSLGPAPAEGVTEAGDIAARRAELNDQMQRLLAPRRAAEEAYKRANGLISEIDTTLRDRQAEELMELGPSPANPALWPGAIKALAESLNRAWTEITDGFNRPGETANPRQNLPGVAFFLAVALALLVRGRYWMEWLTLRIYTGTEGKGNPAVAFVVSLGQVIVPVLGMFALREALYASGVLGLRGQIFAETLPRLGFVLFAAMWLGARTFPRRDSIAAPLRMSAEKRREGRYYFGLLGVLIASYALLSRLAAFDRYDDAALAVLFFPLILTAGLILWRLGQMLRHAHLPLAPGEADLDRKSSYSERLLQLFGRVLIGIGIAAPIMAAIGYNNAAQTMVFPTAATLALLALLAVLRIVVRDVFALVTGRTEQEVSDALTPVLVVFVLCLASLPLFGLIWGMRVTDLLEIWTRFREGFAIGETRISPTDFLTFALVFAIGFGLTRLLQGTLKTSVLPRTKMDVGARTAITSGVGYVGIFLAVIIAITSAGLDLSSLAIVAGALSVGIGFGLQNIVSNFVSGIILLIERPISEGDWIEVGGQMGYVRDISVRSTRIETFDRTDVIVPNADFVSGMVTNWTRGNRVGRVIVPVGVAYGTDTRKVEEVLRVIAEDHPMVTLNPPPGIIFMGFGADSMDFEIRAILRDVNFLLAVKSDMNHAIVAAFAREGIEIPFAQRDLWLRNPETLRVAATAYDTGTGGGTARERADMQEANNPHREVVDTAEGSPQPEGEDGR